jgi:threonine synthase
MPPKGILKTVYDFKNIPGDFNSLKANGFADLLPLEHKSSLPNLKVGDTPMYRQDSIDKEDLPFQLFLKDDSQNPTYSYKDRASAVVSAFAKEKGIDTIIAASTGNAGSSIAGLCAAQKQNAIVLVPETAPPAKLLQARMYGATVIPVKGTYDDAFDLSISATEVFGYYNRNTAYNPLTIEGKKTAAFEIFEQMKFRLPDRIFISVGDGVIISGIYKGFEDLLNLNMIRHMPVIVAVQSQGSDNLVRNLDQESFTTQGSTTIADSIAVDIPRNFYMTRDFIKKYGGEAVAISDGEIKEASVILARNSGLFAEPAAAAAFGGLLRYHRENRIPNQSKNVVLLTGSGLKDTGAMMHTLATLTPIDPDLNELKRHLP